MVEPGSVTRLPFIPIRSTNLLATVLRDGAPRLGRIVSGPSGLSVQIAGQKIPLPSAGSLAPGQAVELTVVTTGQGPALQVRPLDSTAVATPGISTTTPSLISRILGALGTLSPGQAAAAGAVLPKGVPLGEAEVRALIRLFTLQRSIGRPLVRVAALLANAAEAGAVATALVADLSAVAGLMRASDAASFREALRSARARFGRPVEMDLAGLLAGNTELDITALVSENLVLRLQQLRVDEKLQAFLKAAGKHDAFAKAVDAIVENARAGHLQNLGRTEWPYLFIELPLHLETGFERAQVHFFGERNKRSGSGSRGPHVAAFDLRLSQLGDMWITVRTAGGHCACTIDAAATEAIALIREHADELAGALEAGGFAEVTVAARPWDGDRLAAAARVFESFSELDVSA